MNRRKLLGLIATSVGIASAGCSIQVGDREATTTGYPDTPTGVVRAFRTATSWEEMSTLVHPNSDDFDYVELREDDQDVSPKRIQTTSLQNKSEDSATVYIAYKPSKTMCPHEQLNCQTRFEILTLRKTDGKWKLWGVDSHGAVSESDHTETG